MRGVIQTMVMLFIIALTLGVLAPRESTLGSTYKLIYLHLPLLYISVISLILCVAYSFHSLKNDKSYPKAHRAALLGVIFGAATLAVSGVFMTLAWGAISTSEPRVRVMIMVYGLFLIYLGVHRLGNKEVSALYSLFAILMGVGVYYMVVGGSSFQVHPDRVDMPLKIWLPLVPSFLGFSVLYYFLFDLLEMREAKALNSESAILD